MAYQIAPGTIFEITATSVVFLQRCFNIRHYRCVSVGAEIDGIENLDAFAEAWNAGGGLDERYAALQTNVAVQRRIRLQMIWAQRYRAKEYSAEQPNGTYVGETDTANVAASIELASEVANRHGIGRQQLYAIPDEGMLEGEVSAAYFTLMGQLATALTGNITTGTTAVWEPIIYNRASPAASLKVIQAGPKTEVRTQRSRQVRKGI